MRIFIPLVFLMLLAACNGDDNTRRFEGAGLSLYSETQTPKATRDLVRYFDQLCGQANIGTIKVNPKKGDRSFACPQSPTSAQYAKLMQAGLNDIDLRCDQYLGWIDRKRIEALSYRRSAGALEALLGAGLRIDGASADSFAALLAVFSFARDAYDASNFSLLAALESSTIKSIVYKRQKAFRAAANAHSGKHASRESVVFALRNYLLICTPQTIVLDANTFTRDPSAGSPEALREDFQDQFKALTPVTGGQSFGSTGSVGGPQNQTCKGRDKVFSEAPDDKSCADILIAQRFLCFSGRGLDGKSGTNTTNAIKLLETALSPTPGTDPTKRDGLLSDEEFGKLTANGCENAQAKIYQNVWEKFEYHGAAKRDAVGFVIAALNGCYADVTPIRSDALLDDATLRDRVRAFRVRFNVEPGLKSQLTPALDTALFNTTRNNCTSVE